MFTKQMDMMKSLKRMTLADYAGTIDVRPRTRAGRAAGRCRLYRPTTLIHVFQCLGLQEAMQQGTGWRGLIPGVKKSVRAITCMRRDMPQPTQPSPHLAAPAVCTHGLA